MTQGSDKIFTVKKNSVLKITFFILVLRMNTRKILARTVWFQIKNFTVIGNK